MLLHRFCALKTIKSYCTFIKISFCQTLCKKKKQLFIWKNAYAIFTEYTSGVSTSPRMLRLVFVCACVCVVGTRFCGWCFAGHLVFFLSTSTYIIITLTTFSSITTMHLHFFPISIDKFQLIHFVLLELFTNFFEHSTFLCNPPANFFNSAATAAANAIAPLYLVFRSQCGAAALVHSTFFPIISFLGALSLSNNGRLTFRRQ